jgi:hypothetical protein
MMMENILEDQFEGRHSTNLALISFSIGTALFCCYMTFPNQIGLIILGASYVFFAGILNLLMFFNLLYHFVRLPQQRRYIAVKMLILVSNIPVAYVYYCFVLRVYRIAMPD